MTEIRTAAKDLVAELSSFEEQWFSFESGFTDDAPTPSLEIGDFDFEPIKGLLNGLRLGRVCTLPRYLKGVSQYKTPVEYTIVNLTPDLEHKFDFSKEGCTLLVEELCDWKVEIRPCGEVGASVQHSFKPTGRRGGVWLAHKSYPQHGDYIVNLPEEYGEYTMDCFRSHVDLFENERLVDRVPVRYSLEELFPFDKNQVSMLKGDSVFSLPTPIMHQNSLRWFSSNNVEVAHHVPRDVDETTYYLKGWCKDEEQWMQVIDDNENPVTWNINVTDWDFQAIIDSIRFQVSGDAQGIFLRGEWEIKGKLPSTIRWSMVASESRDGFSVEIRRNTIDIRCNATNGYSTPVEFKIDGFDDVANRTFEFPSQVDFGAEALDCIAITLITRDGNIIGIDYDATKIPEGLTKMIHLWVGENYSIEIYPDEHKTVRLSSPIQAASVLAEASWHPYGRVIKQELTMVNEKATQPSAYALGKHNRYLTWHRKLVELINQTPTEDPLEHHLVSMNTELELDGIHEATIRPLLFQFHEDGETTVHKLTPFNSTYETLQPYCIVYNENDESLAVLRLNDDELCDIEFNDDFEIGPNGGLMFRKSGHYIYATQPKGYVYFDVDTPKQRMTGNHEPIVDYSLYNASNGNGGFGRRYTKVVCIEVV
jgi:hypothetical protein